MGAPAIEDGFAEVFGRGASNAYPTERPTSVSLGMIGDSPIGVEPSPPHRLAAWEQPFPCDWTNTCRYVPVYPWAESYAVPGTAR
ncbi:MAG: hypothetical protein ACRENE_13100 [Polyangiaceae bacterium]